MFDSDKDGAINFHEFSALWNYINQWTHCFRSFDKDSSGNIDKNELSMALTQFGEHIRIFFFLFFLHYLLFLSVERNFYIQTARIFTVSHSLPHCSLLIFKGLIVRLQVTR